MNKALSVQGVGTQMTIQSQNTRGNGSQLFDQVMKEQDAKLNNVQIDDENDEYMCTNEELKELNLDNLQSPILDQNPVFIQLRGKLVNFYKRLNKYNIDPQSVRIDNLNLKKTLFEALKKLLRCVIITEDRSLQQNQLNRLYNWFNAKSDALESKESSLAQKMREEQMQKRREMKKNLMEQQSMTYFPPIKKGQKQGGIGGPFDQKSLGAKRDQSERTLTEKTRQTSQMQFTVSRNTIMGAESALDLSSKQFKQEPNMSPIKASYQSVSILQQQPSTFQGYLNRDGGTGGIYTDPSIAYLTPLQETELEEMLEKMDIKDKEYAKHQTTIKKAWLQWGKNQAIRGQKAVQAFERANYGSNFQKLAATSQNRTKSQAIGSTQKKYYYYAMTEQQFLQDPTSSESEMETDESKTKQSVSLKNQNKKDKSSKLKKRSSPYSSGGDSDSDQDGRSDLSRDDGKPKVQIQQQIIKPIQARSTSQGYYTQQPQKEKQMIDLSFEDYQQELNKRGLAPDLGESFLHRNLSKQAANQLNQSLIKLELHKETSRRKIEQLRWQHSSIINGNNQQYNADDQIDNPLKKGSEAMTLSIFSRPNNNQSTIVEYNNVLPEDNYRQFSMTQAKGLFNPKINMEYQKRLAYALQEAEKVRAKIGNQGGGGQKKKAAQSASPNKKKAAKGGEEEEEEQPKVATRNDVRILTLLKAPFRAENYDYRTEQMQEVEDLKQHLAKNNLNVSADIIHKAIVLPEEDDRYDGDKNYPKIDELLFVNPFAKPKKKKKGKKNKKK
ncbi:UNKNOWN [Stylonychia lemnae]|uniref:Uncharacterized protein n=1 Tax=Stylonychia lemnae TaxID=5949 RepID=A0A078A114_STYLE|nr:UNKNOWN [Stylonychia lemnae]|eukprot:CDW75173.1 UNKNOWN [Stylonychia lemnae]